MSDPCEGCRFLPLFCGSCSSASLTLQRNYLSLPCAVVWQVPELKALLKAAGRPLGGRKQDLVDRLSDLLAAHAAPAAGGGAAVADAADAGGFSDADGFSDNNGAAATGDNGATADDNVASDESDVVADASGAGEESSEEEAGEEEEEEEASLESRDNEAAAGAGAVAAPRNLSPWTSPEAPSSEAPSRAAKELPSHLR